MNTLATVVNLIGRAWTVSAEGERREIQVGDRLRGDEMLITEPGARVDLAFDNNQILTFLGEQQQTVGEAADAAQAAQPLTALRPAAEDRGQPDAQPQSADGVPEGHNFVQLVRIQEIIEADGITPLTVARIQEVLRPLGMSLPERVYERDEWREHRGGDERHESGPAARTPGLSVELQGAGPDGVYSDDEISPNGTVPAQITLDDRVREGDRLVVKDGKGTILLDRPVTAEDLRDGVTVEVPVEPGDRNVTVEASVTTPQGFSGNDRDDKPVDNLPPELSTALPDQSSSDSEQITLNVSSHFQDVVSGKNLTYSATDLPPGLSIDPNTGVISGTIDHSASQRDSDGDGQADGRYSVTITVIDEAGNSTDVPFTWTVDNPPPVAANDTNTTLEDTPLHVDASEGVLANDHDPDGDDQLTVTEFTVQGQTYSAGDTAIIPDVGELTLNEDGSYSFVPEPNWHGDVPTVTYTASDGEGGTDTADLNITVTPTDDPVKVEVPVVDDATTPDGNVHDHVVFESGLANGSAPEAEDLKVESSFTVTAPDGLGNSGALVLTYTNIDGETRTLNLGKEQLEQLGNSNQILDTQYGKLVLNGYTENPDGTITVDYEYTLERAPQVSGDDSRDDINIRVTDIDGSTDDATLSIKIVDDAPVARDDANSITEDATVPVTGNVITNGSAGDVADISGADGAEVTEIASDNVAANSATTQPNGDLLIEGQYGTLTISAEGSYSYELDNTNLAVQGLGENETLEEVFSYTLTDGDNDSSDAKLTITVNGSNDGVTVTVPDPNDPADPNYPVIDPADPNDPARGNVNDHVVFESGLTGGSAEDADDTRVVSSFTLSALDGLDDTAAITFAVNGLADIVLSKADVEALGTHSQLITTEYGELLLNGYTENADGTISIGYEYTLTSAPNVAGEHTDDTIRITVNDRDADSDSQDLVIRIIDDAPVAVNDANSIDEDELSISGDVLVNDTQGADSQLEPVTGVSFGGTAGTVGAALSGEYGELNLNADGSYTYELDNSNLVVQGLTDGDTLTETFTYTITDADGDQSTAVLTITINGTNDGVTVDVPDPNDPTDPAYPANPVSGDTSDHVVFESGLTNGSNPNNADLKVESSFTLSALDGLATSGAVELTFINTNGDPRTLSLSKEQVEALDTTSHILDTQYGKLELNGYTLNADGTISIDYEYTLQRAPEVSGDDTLDHIGITVTDRDGDSNAAGSSISIKIVDDAPVARNDANSITEDATVPVTGNVIANGSAGDVADIPGADGAEVTEIASDNVAANSATTQPNGALLIEGQYGTLTISAEGSYSYELDNTNLAVQGLGENETLEEVFSYTLTDGDNDSSDAKLTITVNGSDDDVTVTVPDPTDPTDPSYPVVDPTDPNDPARGDINDHVVFESGLTIGSAENADDTRVVSSFTLSALDGLDETDAITLEVAGNTLILSKAEVEDLGTNSQSITTEYGELVLNGYSLNADGTISIGYEYTLTSAPDVVGEHTDDTIGITVNDRDTDSDSQDLVIRIIDDAPTAMDDANAIAEDDASVSGNVIANGSAGDAEDTLGADGAEVTGVTAGGVPAGSHVSDGGVAGTIVGDYGILVLNADGSYSYELDNANLDVQGLTDGDTLTDTFTYTLTDTDGDQSTATLTITINGTDDGVTVDVPVNDGATTPDGNTSDHVVFESGLPNGSDTNPDDLKVESNFTLVALDGLATSGAVELTYTNTNGDAQTLSLSKQQVEQLGSTPVSLITQYGELVLTGYDQATDGTITIDYEYTLQRAPEVDAVDVRDAIGITVTDRDGDLDDSQGISIKIVDDAPVARDDTNTITEDAAAPVIGNVVTNSVAGEEDTVGADGAEVTGVTAGDQTASGHVADGGVAGSIVGDYGTLVLNADGSYSYQLDNSNLAVQGLIEGEDLTETFTYTLTDADGDQSTARLTITINGSNDDVTVTVPDPNDPTEYPAVNDPTDPNGPARGNVNDHVVFESGLAGGSAPSTDDTRVVSSFTLSALDGLDDTAAITFAVNGLADIVLSKADVEALSANSQTVTTEYGELVLNGYSLNADGTISIGYEYTLTSAPDVAGEHTDDTIGITVNDRDGDNDSQELVIRIIDDVPVARDDTNSIDEDVLLVDGNVITNSVVDEKDTVGADGAEVTGVAAGDQTGSGHVADGNVGTVISGQYGDLTLNTDGSYSYELDNANLAVQGLTDGEMLTETFTYTLTDADGDQSTATLTITVNGTDDGVTVDVPVNDGATTPDGNTSDHVVFESGLPNGSGINPDDLKVESSFTLVALDGLATSGAVELSFTNSNGDPQTLSLSKAQIEALDSNPVTLITQYSELVLNGYDQAADGTITIDYEYTLQRAPEVDAVDVRDDIGIKVTDRDGDQDDSQSISIKIVDDAPQAANDTNTIVEDELSVIGNVRSNDQQGADGAEVTAIASDNASGNSATTLANGDLVIDGQYGTLTISPDGSYTYELDNTNLDVQGLHPNDTPLEEVFSYILTDGDNDNDAAQLTISITGSNDGVTVTVPDPNDPTEYPTVNDPTDPNDSARGNVNDHVVFESGLADGSDPNMDDLKVVSSFTLSALDGLDETDAITLEVAGNTLILSKAEVEDLGNTSQTVTTEYGELVLNGYSLNADGTINIDYEYTLTSAPDVAGEHTDDTIGITVNDRDGDNDSQELVIRIIDDVPVARDDTNSIDEDVLLVDGNVITSSVADEKDTVGADGAEVTGVAAGDQTGSGHVADGNVGTVISGQYGDLTLNTDGSYSYELDNANLAVQGLTDGEMLTETFTYTLTDADGDQSTATLTITVNGTDDGVTVDVPVNDGATTPDGNTSDHVVFESGLPNGSDTNPDDLKVESNFTLVALDGLATSGAVELSFTNSNGDPQTLSLSKEQVEALDTTSQILDTQYGKLELNGYTLNADGSISIDYEYTLQRAPEVSGDDTLDHIGITVTDRDGDNNAAGSNISIKIVDDAPVARNDANEVTEDDNIPATGNVIANGSPDDVVDTTGADGAEVSDIASDNTSNDPTLNVHGDLVIEGQYGNLTISPDGSYSYVLNNNNPDVNALKGTSTPLEDVFTYTLTDGDGDSSDAKLTITINGHTDGPPEVGVTDHNGLDVGDNTIAEDATVPVAGEFTVTAPDGLEEITVGTETVTADALANLGTTPVDITGSEGTLTLTGYDPVTGKVSYEYQQTGNSKDHSAGDNSVTDSFPIIVTDKGGDTSAPSDLVILITDTAPVAHPDTGSIDEDGAALIGNVITDAGAGEDEIGADTTTVTGVTKGTHTGDQSDDNTIGGSGIAGDHGTLVLNSDGSYTYTLDPDSAAVNALKENETLTETFSYTIKDEDGDWSSTTLTITINGNTDGSPTITPEDDNGNGVIDGHNTVYESGLPSGSTEGDDTNIVSGTIEISAGDGLASIGIAGQSVDLNALLNLGGTPVVIPVEGGTLALTGFTPDTMVGSVPTSGTLEYTYTLTGERTHDSAGNDDVLLDIPLSVTDAGNETANGTLTIQVVDDVPTAVADTGNVIEGATLTVDASNGVLDNDISGADGWADTGAVVGVVAGDTNALSSGGVGGRIDGQFGYLTLHADGSYTYVSTADAVTGDEVDVFTYTVRDGDGDLSHTTLTINVADVSLNPENTTTSVNESGLEGGTSEGDDDHIATGQITLSPGLEVIAGSGTTEHGTFTIDKDGNYSYTLTENTSGDNTTDSFTYISKDPNGNTVENTVTINIVDDEPEAMDDVNSIPAGSYAEVTGELINGGLGGAGKDTVGADGATVTEVVNTPVGEPAGTPVAVPTDGSTTTINGQYGVLTIEADGSYSYQRNPGTPGDVEDVFTYTITDGDGDTDDATLTINIGNAAPTISDLTPKLNGGELTFEEKHLADGSAPDGAQLIKTGGFTVSSPDGVGSLTVGGVTVIADGALSGTTAVTTPQGHTLEITGYDPVTGRVTYEYTLTDREDHDQSTSDTELFDDIPVVLTDRDGDSANDILSVRIVDDVPEASDDTNSIVEDGPAITGNVIEGDPDGGVADTKGADGATVTDISSTSGNPVDDSDPSGVLVIDGEFGTLTISPDGSYTYELNNDNADVNALKTGDTLTEEFTYTLTDTDGDSDTAKLTITINGHADGNPSITPDDGNDPGIIDGHNTVNESGLAGGSTGGDGSESVDGTIQISAGDGLASITIGGQAFDLADLQALSASTPSAAIPVEGGTLVLTGFNPGFTVGGVPTTGELQYTYTLTGERTHSNVGNDDVLLDIPLSITDAGNETATGTLTIQVVDDVPTAVNDIAEVAAGEFELVQNGNVLDNDTQGADGARVTSVTPSNGTETSVPGTGNLIIDGNYGKLTIHSDGSYSYQRNPGTEGGVEDIFTYTITDGDGDLDTAILTIEIGDATPVIDSIPAAGSTEATVHESGLPDGSDNIPDRATTSGTIEFSSPDGLGSVSLGGNVLTATSQPFTTSGPDGSLTARYEYNEATGKGTIHYSFTLEATTAGDDTSVTFPVVISDGDTTTAAETVNGNLVINIVDDEPRAVADEANVTEGATLTVMEAEGVLSNDIAGADNWDSTGAVVGVTAGDTGATSTTGVGSQIETDYGYLTLAADGSYTYEAKPNATEQDVEDIFTYTVRDADGDLSLTTLTINVSDVTGISRNTADEVDEAGLTDGTDPASDKETTTGTLNLGDGWTVEDSTQTSPLGTLTINADGTYSYTLNNQTVHGADDETDTFTYTARDQYDNTVINTVTITIIDDVPSVISTGNAIDAVQVDETTMNASKSANFSGAFNHHFGADGDNGDGLVYTLEVDTAATGLVDTLTGQDITLVDNGGIVEGQNENGDVAFTIEVDASGAVTLTQARPLHHDDPNNHDDVLTLPAGSLTLTATATDGDGDTDSASVDIGGRFSFRDDGPSIGAAPAPGAVDEAYLTTGSGEGTAGLSTGATADLDVTFGADGQGALVFSSNQPALRAWLDASGNTDIDFAVNDDVLTATRGGQSIFTVTLEVDGSGQASYRFELQGSMLHRDPDQDHQLTFDYEAVDGDGDSASGSFVVEVVDDNPRTEIEISMLEDQPYGPFTTSADARPDNITISTADGGSAITGTPNGSNTDYDVGHGTVTVHEDGRITYTPLDDYSNHGNPDEFYVTVAEDHTGSVTTKVTVDVIPVADAPELSVDNPAVTTDEDVAIALGLNAPQVTDDNDQSPGKAGDNPELLGLITLSGIPAGAALLDGTAGNAELLESNGGDITILLSDGPHLSDLLANPPADTLVMTTAQYETLMVLPPAESHVNFTVNVGVTSYEVDESGNRLTMDVNGDPINGAESTTSVTVNVQAVTDGIDLKIHSGDNNYVDADSTTNAVALPDFDEDSSINLKDYLQITLDETGDGNTGADTDGSEERWFEVSGVPVGWTVNGVSITTPGQSVRVDIPDDYNGASPSLPDILIEPQADFSGDLDDVQVTLHAQDRDSDGPNPVGTLISDTVHLNLRVNPVAGDVAASGVTTEEDTAVAFLQHVRVTDTGTGSEVIDSLSFALPDGWVLSQQPSASAAWSIGGTGAELDPYIITFHSGTQAEREALLQEFEVTPPAHSSKDEDIVVRVTSTDTNSVGGSPVSDTDYRDLTIEVEVTPVAERTDTDSDGQNGNDVTINPDHDYQNPGEEDEWFQLGTEAGFNLKDGWNNEDGRGVENGGAAGSGSEETFALLMPHLIAGDGGEANAIGSQFQYFDGSQWVVETFGGDPIEVPMEYLHTLQFKAAPHFSGMFEIQVQAKTVDYDEDYPGDENRADIQVSGNATLTNVLIEPRADAVTATVTARVEGDEDESMNLSIRPKSSDPSESFEVDIDSIPDGATLWYDGVELTSDTDASALPNISITNNPDGSWKIEFTDFDPAKGDAMEIQAPEDSNEPFDLDIAIRSVDELHIPNPGGTPDPIIHRDVSSDYPLTITVAPKGIADEAILDLIDYDDPGVGFTEAQLDTEGGVMLSELIVNAELKDDDGSETLTFKISNLPEGFTIEGATFMGGSGTDREWSLTEAQLANAKLVTPPNFNGSQMFDFYSITTEDDNDSLTQQHSVELRVSPSPEATINLGASIDEDVSTQLDFSIVHRNGDTDEVLEEVWISAAALDDLNLTYGENGPDLADGQSGVQLDNGWYKLTGAAIDSIYAQGRENWHGNAQFDVHYVIKDPARDSSVNDVSEGFDDTYEVTVNPITDQVTLEDPADISLTSPGNTSITLNIGNTDGDYDGSEELTRIILENVPEGVVVVGTADYGVDYVGGGTWVLMPTDGSFNGVLTPSIALQVHGRAGGLDDHQVRVTVVTEDAGNGVESRASTDVGLTTTFAEGDPEDPAVIERWEQTTFEPTEDAPFNLGQAIDAQIDATGVTDSGFTITLTALPTGTQVTGMTRTEVNGEEVWSVSGQGGDAELQNLLNGITVQPPLDWNSNKGPFEYDATLTTHTPTGGRAQEKITVNQSVIPVTDEADISIDMPAVDEGNDLAISINVSNPSDDPNWTLVDGTLYLTLDESGMSADGGTLRDASGNALTPAPDGRYVIENVTPGTPINLTYEALGPYVSGSISIEASVTGQEDGAASSLETTVSQQGDVNPVNNGYDFEVIATQGDESAVAGSKENAIRLDITDNGLLDSDGSESITAILLENLPNDFLVFVGEDAASATLAEMASNAGGSGTNTWLLEPGSDGNLPKYIAILPPKNWSGTLEDLGLKVISGEDSRSDSATDTRTFDLRVDPVANGLAINPTPSFGREGEIIGLNLIARFEDLRQAGSTDESVELATVELKGLGEHAAIYVDENLIMDRVAYDELNDVYTITGLTQDEIDQLGFVQAADAINDLKVRARTEEYDASTGQPVAGVDPSDWTADDWNGADGITANISAQFGTAGEDKLLWTGQGVLDGRSGDDTIQLRFGESLGGDELAAHLRNIEMIDLGIEGANTIDGLKIDDVLQITDSRNVLKIFGDSEDSVSLDDGSAWSHLGQETEGGKTFSVYEGSGATLWVEQGVQGIIID